MAHHVFLSAGHGGSDPGAVGHGLKEKDINLGIMLACRDELQRHGVKVTTSRTTDANDPVQQEVAEANASGAELAFSVHTNAGGGDGSETYYWSSSTQGKKLAALCEKHMRAIGQNSRGIKAGDGLMFINSTNATAVLVEIGFIDNKTDKALFDTAAEQKRIGVAYAHAILECFGIVPKAATAATTATTSGTWIQEKDGRWWYKHADGSYTKSGWESIGGAWYWFDSEGWMIANTCKKIGGKWYAFSASGAMLTGSIRLNTGGDMRLN